MKGFVKIQVENQDDLWYLSHIIDLGDSIKGSTIRKIKLGDGSDRNVKIIKKKVFLRIDVEKIEFHKYSDNLRVSGKITEGPEDISTGTYHTFNIDDQTVFTLNKKEFLKYQLDKLKEATKPKKIGVLLCAFDRECATFALMKNYGFEVLSELCSNVQQKNSPEIIKSSSFYKDMEKLLKEYSEKYQASKIVIGSPAFWKEYLMKEIKEEGLRKKIITASINNTGKAGIGELIRRPEVITALSEDRIVSEINSVERLLTEIKMDGKAAYGMNEVLNAVNAGAVEELLVTDKLIHTKRQDGSYVELDNIMKTANSMQAKVHIISSDHDGGKKLDGLGGIGGILRYKL